MHNTVRFSLLLLMVGAVAQPVSAQLVVTLQPLQDGVVQVRFSNQGKESLTLLKHHTPVEAMESNLFRVIYQGRLMPYAGKLAYRMAPEADSWLTLPPQDSVTAEVNLAQHYAIPQSGTYAVCFSYPIALRYGDGDRRRSNGEAEYYEQEMTSPVVQVPLTKAYCMAADAESRSERGFVGCSGSQQQDISAAMQAGKTMASSASQSLAGGSPGGQYQVWFGQYQAQYYERVKSNFKRIEDAFSKSWTYNCTSCQPGVLAYVYPNNPYQVWICNYLHSQQFSPRERASVLLHEATHWSSVAATKDHGYGESFCKNLAYSSPAQAIENADNYRFYCLSGGR